MIRQFIKLMKSEPKKKFSRWKIGEDKILDIDDINKHRAVCKKLKWDGLQKGQFYLVRDWFMIELGLFTGLRVDEMRQLKIGNVLIKGKRSSIFVQKGKGGRKRTVWINDEFKKIFQEYIKLREKCGLENSEDTLLLTSKNGLTITKRGLQKAFKRCIKEAGLSEKYSIHCLRHTYGTFLLKASHNIKLALHFT